MAFQKFGVQELLLFFVCFLKKKIPFSKDVLNLSKVKIK